MCKNLACGHGLLVGVCPRDVAATARMPVSLQVESRKVIAGSQLKLVDECERGGADITSK